MTQDWYGPLLPPSTPAHLPHGLQRGGVLAAPWIPPTYIDASRPTVPTDSPMSHDVSFDIFMTRVPFARPDVARPITGAQGFGQPPGYQRRYTSYNQGHRHHMDFPITAMGAMRHSPVLPRGEFVESANLPPLPIHRYRPVATPHGTTEGGIFGPSHYINGQALPSVPQQLHRDIVLERQNRAITGFGAGPDGLG